MMTMIMMMMMKVPVSRRWTIEDGSGRPLAKAVPSQRLYAGVDVLCMVLYKFVMFIF